MHNLDFNKNTTTFVRMQHLAELPIDTVGEFGLSKREIAVNIYGDNRWALHTFTMAELYAMSPFFKEVCREIMYGEKKGPNRQTNFRKFQGSWHYYTTPPEELTLRGLASADKDCAKMYRVDVVKVYAIDRDHQQVECLVVENGLVTSSSSKHNKMPSVADTAFRNGGITTGHLRKRESRVCFSSLDAMYPGFSDRACIAMDMGMSSTEVAEFSKNGQVNPNQEIAVLPEQLDDLA